MSKIEIKDLYLVFGNEKQKALKPWCVQQNPIRLSPSSIRL